MKICLAGHSQVGLRGPYDHALGRHHLTHDKETLSCVRLMVGEALKKNQGLSS